jgi:dipeptidase D
MATNPFTGLQPERLWHYFSEILTIPRPSRKEEHIAAYLVGFGKRLGLETFRDKTGNIIIRKPAAKGYEDTPGVILQGHIDMVCEKNSGYPHDFEKDPIQAYVENGWVKASGTTLGADDGIGVAAMMALLEAGDIVHGPMECLFTVDEETGLTGAFGLEPGSLHGRILLNLDSEDDGEFFIGCAGGKDTVIKLPFIKEAPPAGALPFEIRVTGLTGGHSGDDIHKGRGNANKVLNRILWRASRVHGIRLSHFDGGNLRNAIAREAFAVIMVPQGQVEGLKTLVGKMASEIASEYRITEPNLAIGIHGAPGPGSVISASSQASLLNALYACPHGVMAYSASIPNFVETSTNLASVKTKEDHFLISTSQRSSIESAKHDVSSMVAALFEQAGATVEHSDGYPGWTPDPASKILGISVSTYEALFGEKPVVRAIHAGLECGIIGDKFPGMDMISYGPTIRGAHSPDERLEISTVQKFWSLTARILEKVAKTC